MSDHLILKLVQCDLQLENTVRKLKYSYFLTYKILHGHISYIVKYKKKLGINTQLPNVNNRRTKRESKWA